MQVSNGIRISTNGAYGVCNMNAGSVTIAGEGFTVGYSNVGSGTLNMNGGTIQTSELVIGRAATSRVTLAGGANRGHFCQWDAV